MNIISEKVYKKIILDNYFHLKNIENICKDLNEPIEGNYFLEHETGKIQEHKLNKQINLFSLAQNSKNVLEIGFNAGHSCLLYLLANPNSKILCFDICHHKYTIPCFEYLNKSFPNRLTLISGDSNKTVPRYKNHQKYDLIHIDGNHKERYANRDFINCYPHATKYIVWDDTQIKKLDNLLNKYIDKKLVYEIKMLPTVNNCHRIVHVN